MIPSSQLNNCPVWLHQLFEQFPCRLPDSSVTAQTRLPAECREFLDGESHLRYVTRPAAISAGVLILGIEVHLVGDDSGDAIDGGRRPRPKVVGIHGVVGGGDDMEHRVDTVRNVKIGFLLAAVAENGERLGVLDEFLDEIRNYGPTQTGTDDVCKPKVPDRELVTVGPRREQAFVGEFARTVGTDRFQRGEIFGCRPRGLTVDR